MLEEMILNSEASFKGILDYVQEERNDQPIDEVEKELFLIAGIGTGLVAKGIYLGHLSRITTIQSVCPNSCQNVMISVADLDHLCYNT